MGFGGSGGGGGNNLAGSSDVTLNNPANQDFLAYDAGISQWSNKATDFAQVVHHGSDANAPRPDTTNTIIWVGDVEPNLKQAGDLYFMVESESGGGPTAPFDGLGTPHRALSLRRLLSTYNGPLIRVRRASDDQELDIGFVANGELDTAALLAFAASGSAYVTTWYDQSGNARHCVQATNSRQPRIVNSGAIDTLNAKPALTFDGTDDFLTSNVVGLYAAGSATVSAVLAAASAASTIAFSEHDTIADVYRVIRNSNGALRVQSIADSTTLWDHLHADATLFNTTQRQIFYVDTGTTISTWSGGTLLHNAVTATRSGTPTPNRTSIGAQGNGSGSSFLTGKFQEIIAWTGNNSSNRSNIQAAQAYWTA